MSTKAQPSNLFCSVQIISENSLEHDAQQNGKLQDYKLAKITPVKLKQSNKTDATLTELLSWWKFLFWHFSSNHPDLNDTILLCTQCIVQVTVWLSILWAFIWLASQSQGCCWALMRACALLNTALSFSAAFLSAHTPYTPDHCLLNHSANEKW